MHLGVVAGIRDAARAALCAPTPLAGSEALAAPVGGPSVLSSRDLGERVAAGDVVAEITDLADRAR